MKIIRAAAVYLNEKSKSLSERFKKIPAVAFIFCVIERTSKENIGDMAAGIAYYSILSIFPLLLGTIAVFGVFLPSQEIQDRIFAFANQYLPASVSVIKENVGNIIKLRSVLGVISIIGVFWTGSAVFEALGRVINKAWEINKPRPFFRRKARILLMSFGTGVLFLLSMAATAFSSIIPKINLPILNTFTAFFAWLLGFTILFIVIILLLKFLPNAKTSWRDIWPGAVFTTVVFEIARTIFTYYLGHFSRYNVIYGSLAAVIILLLWIYFSAIIFIIGTEVTYEFAQLLHEHHH